METPKNQVNKGLINRHIRANQCDIPVTAAAFHQFHDLIRCGHAFLIGRFRAVGLKHALGCSILDRSLEKFLPDDIQRQRMLRDHFDLNIHTSAAGALIDLPGGVTRFFEGQHGRIHLVAVQAHRDTGRNFYKIFDDRQVLAGKVRETVYVKNMFFPKCALFQLFQQPGHLVSEIPLSPAAQAVIAFHQERKLLQLLGKAAFGFLRCPVQIL